jgi:disulfide bond formation protein DsbB
MAWWEELVDWAGDQVPILFRASGLCSDPAWKFLGLSIADWSLGMFALLLLLAAHTLLRRQ